MQTRTGSVISFKDQSRERKEARPPKIETRTTSLIPLIDLPYLSQLTGSRLPEKGDVFAHFFFLHKIEKIEVSKAMRSAVQAAGSFWDKVGITTKWINNGVSTLMRVFNEYQAKLA